MRLTPLLLCLHLTVALVFGCSSADAPPPSSIPTQALAVDVVPAPAPQASPTHALIREYAAEKASAIGRPVQASALPSLVIDAAHRELAERTALNDAASRGAGSASFRKRHAFIEIASGDEVIGYAVHIDDSVDHPSFTGSGVHLFYDLNGTVVATNEWADHSSSVVF